MTFDDGPSIYTEQIINILKEYNISAIFFFIGCNIEEHKEAVYYTHSNGLTIGNHSFSHRRPSLMTQEQQKEDIMRTNEIIEDLLDYKIKYYRPPYGEVSKELEQVINEIDMKTVLWNKDPADWDKKDSNQILQYVMETKPYGGIYLLHEKPETVEALPMIIEFLLKQGIEFVCFD